MSYRELYDFCQTLDPRIRRPILIDKVCELTRRPPPRIIVDGIDPAVLRGYFIQADNPEHPFAKFAEKDGAVIVVARGMNYCWRRFVTVKELMHYFDEPLQLVGTADEFEALVSGFVAPSLDKTEAMRSESLAFWMALGVLCPEPHRQNYQRRLAIGEIQFMDVAQELKIPVQYVPSLFDPKYKRFIQMLTGR